MLKNIVIEGVKYWINSNVRIDDALLKAYVKTMKKVINDIYIDKRLYRILELREPIEIILNEKLFRNGMKNLFIMQNYHAQNGKAREELFVNKVIEQQSIMFIQKNMHVELNEYRKYTSIIYRLFCNELKITITNSDIVFKEKVINEFDKINNNMEKINEDIKSVKSFLNENEKYKKELEEARLENNQLLREIGRLKEITFRNTEGLNDLLGENVMPSISRKIKDDIELAFEWYSKQGYNNALNILEKYKDILYENYMFKYVYANTLSFLYKDKEAIKEYELIFRNDYFQKYSKNKIKMLNFLYGNCLYREKRYSQAYVKYRNAFNLDNNFVISLFNAGLTKFQQSVLPRAEYIIEYLAEARKCFADYIDIDKTNSFVYFNIGKVQSILGDLEDAIENFIISSRLTDSNTLKIENFTGLMICYLLLNDDKKVKKYIDLVEEMLRKDENIVISPNSLWLYYQMKGVYFASYDFEIAVSSFYLAYKALPTEENRKNFIFNKEHAYSINIQFGRCSVIRSVVRK